VQDMIHVRFFLLRWQRKKKIARYNLGFTFALPLAQPNNPCPTLTLTHTLK
jgi:hypothetical protein